MADETQRIHGNRAAYMQRVADAYGMRVRGAGWAEIARATGYSTPQNAMRAVKSYTGKLPTIESTDQLRSLWRDRLEFLWPLAVRDAEDGRPGAMRAAVAVADRAAKLDGLDSPLRVEISPDEAELEAVVNRIVAMSGEREIVDAEVIELEALPRSAEG